MFSFIPCSFPDITAFIIVQYGKNYNNESKLDEKYIENDKLTTCAAIDKE